MPITLISSGSPIMRSGVEIQPMAEQRTCDTCGYLGAAFGSVDRATGKVTIACGWRDGAPVCVGKGTADLFGEVA